MKQNEAELTVLKRYLPAQLDEAKVREIAKGVIAQMGTVALSDFGKVMGAVMKQTQGAADGTMVSKVVKEMLK